MNIDESFLLMLSFFIFCFIFAKPIIINISKILEDKISYIKEKIFSSENSREIAFKDLKKTKRLFLSTKKELEDHIRSFSSSIAEAYRKNYSDSLVAFEKKYHHGLKFLQIQRNQKILGLYDNLLDESSYYAKDYILKHRSKLPDDVEIAKELIKNI